MYPLPPVLGISTSKMDAHLFDRLRCFRQFSDNVEHIFQAEEWLGCELVLGERQVSHFGTDLRFPGSSRGIGPTEVKDLGEIGGDDTGGVIPHLLREFVITGIPELRR